MIHPELGRYKNRPAVQAAIADYRKVWKETINLGYPANRAIKNAEYRLNLIVEEQIAPKR